MASPVRLKDFDASTFDKGASTVKQSLWFLANALVVKASWNPFQGVKRFLLRAFGARIGKGFVIKNNVNIKSPWNLVVGDHCWLGEGVWIDNLDKVNIGNNVCISQGVMLLTGNHDYKDPTMAYRNAPIKVEDGVWIGARAIVCPGVVVGENAVLIVGSVARHSLDADCIYEGNPATMRCVRKFNIAGQPETVKQ